MSLQPRPYQRESVDALYAYWRDDGGNGLIVLPTGAGKSLVIATLVRELLEQWPALRIGILTHVKELLSQNAQELLRLWPAAPVGIYSAGLGKRDVHQRVLFMGIQSVHNKAARLGKFDILLVDEAHLIPRNSDTMYGRFINACRDAVPDMRLVGLTATPFRLDSGRLDRGKDRMFDDVVYDANVSDLIDQGYLSPLISKATDAEIDVSAVSVRGGEFVSGELERAAMDANVVRAAATEIVARGAERAGWLAFCSGVEHAHQVRDEIRLRGITCETITGDTPAGERDSIIRRYKERKIRCLTSVGVLTTGFNAPHVDLLAMLRPTLSTGLYVQMVGRGFRLADGKENCLVLDFAGNVRRHGPVDAVKPRPAKGVDDKQKEEETEFKVKADSIRAKVCPSCETLNGLGALQCTNPHCGFEWPKPEPKHQPKAEAVPILAQKSPAWLDVIGMAVRQHVKVGKPDSVRLDYNCGMVHHREWLAFESGAYARQKASEVWRRLGGDLPIPATTVEALNRQHELTAPAQIMVKREDSGFYSVTNRQMPLLRRAAE